MNEIAKDPVCGMEIIVDNTTLKTVHEGKTYYFCSGHCQEQFEKNPASYVKQHSECCGNGKHDGHKHHGQHDCCH